MSGSAGNGATNATSPFDTEHLPEGQENGAADPEATSLDAIPPDLSNRTLVDEEGPF